MIIILNKGFPPKIKKVIVDNGNYHNFMLVQKVVNPLRGLIDVSYHTIMRSIPKSRF